MARSRSTTPRAAKSSRAPAASRQPAASSPLGIETALWAAADKLRGVMDAAEYKHVVLGLVFLKYVSDAFAEHHDRLVADAANGADAEDPDEYRAVNVFWVPPEARWTTLQASARQPTIGKLLDAAMLDGFVVAEGEGGEGAGV